ncbi:hypothetical protein [Marinobacterium iners]|uniref:Immunity protein 50 n=1 Tax=Marinobacterium iners DSM 11526 TaxID=1122198 RepID=A0A1H4HB49_9GAMM|nr:hypothetical protein [Marinobacterium iners]SEB19024.1 hypothetical protein SAMN02745729_1411 [Marinobacterium iners DSM 11526]
MTKEKFMSDLHDWEIYGLDINRDDRKIIINIWFPDTGSKAQIILEGVSKFLFNGAMLQNVILDVLIFEEASSSDYFKYGCKILNIDSSFFDGKEGFKLIYIEPSVGVELSCLCKKITYEEALNS